MFIFYGEHILFIKTMYADVIVDIAAQETDKIFEYSFTDGSIFPGSRVVVPFGKTYIEGIVISVKKDCSFDAQKIKPIARVLEDIPALTSEMLSLCDYITKTCYVSRASALRLFLPVEMRKGKVKEQFTTLVSIEKNVDVSKALESLKKSAVKQKEALIFISENEIVTISRANLLFGNQAIKSLIQKGFLVTKTEKYFRSPYKNIGGLKREIELTDSQKSAVHQVENGERDVSLIFGVTGSGKTEIYLELIDRTIRQGKSAIMLVPEIALTPQMLKHLRARFGENAAIIHSGLSAGERFDEWWRLRNGDAKIAIGARSAIFAPLENIGLIVIDEEHDGSYISESSPRYSTIDVAKFRAKLSSAKLILGSATPSIDTFRRAQDGDYNLITLKERINKKPLPEIEIVDMRREIRRGNNSPFSSTLISEIEKCLEKRNQVMLFLNQRGYSRTVICTECGHVQKCKDCDVSLTYHKDDDALLCHYCGAKYKMIDACTECGSPFIRYSGFGTERIALELNKIFPDVKVLRMDRDTTQNKDSHFKILEDFSNNKASILVGTQMIAKGHDFPNVTLVGILDADMSLHFSDYRSGERTFQLLTQVSGRCGRADMAGKVVLQTYSPDNLILKFALSYNYEGFFQYENSIRKATGFPPYNKIVRVLISGEDEEKVVNVTKTIYGEIGFLHCENKSLFTFFGCMKAPLKRLQNKFRYQILMRVIDENNILTDKIFSIIDKYNNRSVSVYMEINPNNLT